MSPRFEPDFENVRSSIRTFDRGEYLIKVSGVKPFAYIREKDNALVAGIQYNLTMEGKLDAQGNPTDEFKGESVTPNKVYVHSEGAYGVAKGFVMAALGYDRDEEDQFNAEIAREHSFAFDVDEEAENIDETIELGDGWKLPEGKLLIVTLDKKMYDPKDGTEPREQQDFKSFVPSSRIGQPVSKKGRGKK